MALMLVFVLLFPAFFLLVLSTLGRFVDDLSGLLIYPNLFDLSFFGLNIERINLHSLLGLKLFALDRTGHLL